MQHALTVLAVLFAVLSLPLGTPVRAESESAAELQLIEEPGYCVSVLNEDGSLAGMTFSAHTPSRERLDEFKANLRHSIIFVGMTSPLSSPLLKELASLGDIRIVLANPAEVSKEGASVNVSAPEPGITPDAKRRKKPSRPCGSLQCECGHLEQLTQTSLPLEKGITPEKSGGVFCNFGCQSPMCQICYLTVCG